VLNKQKLQYENAFKVTINKCNLPSTKSVSIPSLTISFFLRILILIKLKPFLLKSFSNPSLHPAQISYHMKNLNRKIKKIILKNRAAKIPGENGQLKIPK